MDEQAYPEPAAGREPVPLNIDAAERLLAGATAVDDAPHGRDNTGVPEASRLRTTGLLRAEELRTGSPDDDEPVAFPIDPVSDSGVHALEVMTPAADVHHVECPHCGGMGAIVKSTTELLRESLRAATAGRDGDAIVRDFYARLLDTAPDLAPLFPADLTTGDALSAGATQRDRLLKALLALADLYVPGDAEKMDRLTTAVRAFGRSHAAFSRPDGTVRGASLEEYAAVKLALFAALKDAIGDGWVPAFGYAWSQAYDFAAAEMMAEQHRSGFTFPRQPRAGQS